MPNRTNVSRLLTMAGISAMAFALSACGSGGGGGGGVNPPTDQGGGPPPPMTFKSLGVAVFSDDSYRTTGAGYGEFDIVSLYDSNGNFAASPALKRVPVVSGYDIESIGISPDASVGVFADGARQLRFFSKLGAGGTTISAYTLDVSSYGNDVDAVVMLPSGDAAVAAPDTNNSLILVNGILSGHPVVSSSIPVPDLRNGLVLSNDGKTMMARGYSGVTVYSISGSSGASIAQTGNLANVPGLDSADARAGMAISPADSTRGVVVGHGPQISLLTNLSTSPAIANTAPVQSASNAFAVAISPDGKTAFVGTDSGVAVFSGVDTGTLAQVQTYAPPIGAADQMVQITSLAATLDGRALVVLGRSKASPSGTNGYLEVLPIGASGLGSPLATLSGVPVPDNDQMIIH